MAGPSRLLVNSSWKVATKGCHPFRRKIPDCVSNLAISSRDDPSKSMLTPVTNRSASSAARFSRSTKKVSSSSSDSYSGTIKWRDLLLPVATARDRSTIGRRDKLPGLAASTRANFAPGASSLSCVSIVGRTALKIARSTSWGRIEQRTFADCFPIRAESLVQSVPCGLQGGSAQTCRASVRLERCRNAHRQR